MESCLSHAIKNLLHPSYKFVLEFGVYKGDSLHQIASLLDGSYQIFGFDSFEGLPEDWLDSEGKLVGRGKRGRFTTENQIPNINNVEFYRGWFKDTIPQYKGQYDNCPIALLHVDCDLYNSTKEVLYGLRTSLLPGSIIVFDEWFYNHDSKYNDHEQKAFYEWINDFNIKFELVGYYNTEKEHEEEQIVVIK